MGPRMSFQRWWARKCEGTILNIGSADDPCGIGPREVPPGLGLDVTHLDLDYWPLPKFIQADAHNIPSPDQSFDMVLMGDIHEHLVDPLKATLEAARVARRFLVMTIFEEWRLPAHGQHIEAGLERAAQEVLKNGFEDFDAYMAKTYPGAKTVPDTGEGNQAHHFHINQFADSDINNLVRHVELQDPDWQVRVFWKVSEATHEGHEWFNWLIALERYHVNHSS